MELRFRIPKTGIDAVDRALTALVDGLRPLSSLWLADATPVLVSRDKAPSGTPRLFPREGVLTPDIRLVAGEVNIVPHTLGRVPSGWLLAGIDGAAHVWSKTPDLPHDPARYLALFCSADVTVRLVVLP